MEKSVQLVAGTLDQAEKTRSIVPENAKTVAGGRIMGWIKDTIICEKVKAIFFLNDEKVAPDMLDAFMLDPAEAEENVLESIVTLCPRLEGCVLYAILYNAEAQRVEFVISHPSIPTAKKGKKLPTYNLLDYNARM